MTHFDYLIVGGGVAGTTAAEAIRDRDPVGSIVIVSDEPYPLYSRVMLPHYVKGAVPREKLFLRSLQDYAARKIEFLGGRAAAGLDTSRRLIALDNGEELGFGKLLIASGGRPRPLGISGAELEGVSRFQTIADADAMLRLLPSRRRAVVVGGGFIALEYLEILHHFRVPTALVMRGQRFFNRHLDVEGAELLGENFRRHGIETILAGDALAAIQARSGLRAIKTESGRTIECDFLGIGIGLERNTGWLAASGLTLTPQGVRSNEFLETDTPGIFAAGDVSEFYDLTSKIYHSRGNWTNSFLAGQVAGRHMARPEEQAPFERVSSYSIKSLDFIISFVGETELRPGLSAITRSNAADDSYQRFFLWGHRLVGAVLINRPQDKAALTTLIQSATPIPDVEGRLNDSSFDISTLTG